MRGIRLIVLFIAPVCGYTSHLRPVHMLRRRATLPMAYTPRLPSWRQLLPFTQKQGGADRERDPAMEKYGGDPRKQAVKDDWHDPGRSWSTGSPGEVSELYGGVDHLQAVLDAASDRLVVIKYKRRGCKACGSTIAPFESAAAAYDERALFFTVDFDQCRAFCVKCAIKAVPCVHIYARGELLDALPLGPTAWSRFAQYMVQLCGPPASEVTSPDKPHGGGPHRDDPWSRVTPMGLI